jgi:hypothetical protein
MGNKDVAFLSCFAGQLLLTMHIIAMDAVNLQRFHLHVLDCMSPPAVADCLCSHGYYACSTAAAACCVLSLLQCLCAGCAGLYDYATKGCPICRQPVEETLEVE